jgi:hypothetical protein
MSLVQGQKGNKKWQKMVLLTRKSVSTHKIYPRMKLFKKNRTVSEKYSKKWLWGQR